MAVHIRPTFKTGQVLKASTYPTVAIRASSTDTYKIIYEQIIALSILLRYETPISILNGSRSDKVSALGDPIDSNFPYFLRISINTIRSNSSPINPRKEYIPRTENIEGMGLLAAEFIIFSVRRVSESETQVKRELHNDTVRSTSLVRTSAPDCLAVLRVPVCHSPITGRRPRPCLAEVLPDAISAPARASAVNCD